MANEIERKYPGHVEAIHQVIKDDSGNVVAEFDIVTKNAVIEVKSGSGQGLSGQLTKEQQHTDKPVIGYGPDLKPSVVKQAEKDGHLVTTERNILLEVIQPDPPPTERGNS
ncbi:hypothetical protein HYR99_09860 [Candidatus Poribacteria bacterium]|nr:hypothetical protein [Candidatus Poribacteria bacterium]